MPGKHYIEVILPLPVHGTFTYSVNADHAALIKPGIRVTVPFGSKQILTALTLKIQTDISGSYEVREILGIIDEEPVVLPSQLELWKWMSEYYMCALGEVYKAAMPANLKTGRRTRKKTITGSEKGTVSLLNEAQEKALAQVREAFMQRDVCLLHGVTSSGKTEIYIHLIREALEKNKQVLYLLPEIALTTQIISRLQAVFGSKVAVYHSKYSNAERVKTWYSMLQANENQYGENSIRVILGVRSAVFLPFVNPGLIIIDEEHENTFKQFDPAPRYHARDTAIMLARLHGSKVLLGTATPSVESYHNCVTGKFGLIELNERYLKLQLPEISVVNTRELKRRKQMHSHFSPVLLDHIDETLKNGEQVILFQNRRGFSLFLECQQCGEVPKCKSCDVSLTYHKKHNRLYCHYCGYQVNVPLICPSCNEGEMKLRGFGTEKIEEEIALFFPHARVERMDTDSTGSRKAYEKLITRFELKQSDILVGTQMVSKGLDFDNVKVVGILDADTMLNYPDFRAHERSFQLMAQVSGRAGRKNSRGKVIIQTAYNDHPVINHVVHHNYPGMYKDEIEERKRFSYPPFSRLVEITLRHRNVQILDVAAASLASKLQQTIHEKISGPEYPLVSRIRNLYLKSMLIKIERKAYLNITKDHIIKAVHEMKSEPDFKSVQYTIDVDPY